MAFGEPKFEKIIYQAEEKEQNRKKLVDFIKEISGNLREEGLPAREDCRIDMDSFGEVYPEKTIKEDRREIESYEKDWQVGLSEEKRTKTEGEKLEMLKTAIFSKFLGKDFIVARSSLYDDVKNNIDNVILEKETGNLICALDEAGESSGKGYEEKKTKVLERNRQENGGSLKYGFKLEKDREGKKKINFGQSG